MNHDDSHNFNRLSLIAKAQGAFLGAAVGDALGWPQELPYNRLDKQKDSPEELFVKEFQRWVRKSGGQYYPHQEVILPGEYSDDMQLLLSTARSLLYGEQWWHHLTKRELPTWTRYERGGGGATKRAAHDWLTGREPWSSPDNKKKYFDAGGNGVAMRILPHCLLGATETDFGKIAKNIVANGVSTHGHPRALVGALAYGFAVWMAFREVGTLQYGSIIEKVLSEVKSWSVLPELGNLCASWKHSAQEVNAQEYDKLWQQTVEEMLQLLEQCKEAMKQGALSVDRQVLTELGCFDKSIKGAGTVTAAASIFLASRYAADPFNGLVEAAFAKGADTDTIASMTGGLLGSVAGIEWLGDHAERVQDATYIRKFAEHLAKNQANCQTKEAEKSKTTRAELDALIEKLEASKSGDTVLIPDGRKAQTSEVQTLHPLSKATQAVFWKLIADDGQTLYIKKVSRQKTDKNLKTETTNSPSPARLKEVELQPVKAGKIALRIPVRNMQEARFFYEKTIGLKVEDEKETLVKYSGIALVRSDSEKRMVQQSNGFTPNTTLTICIEVESLEAVYNNVCQVGSKLLQPISEKRERQFFTCLDPDGNAVEVIEMGF
jgi:ADP-ribosylglycohydrolase/predicted enzyme related to lactoylglutathione lyase